MSVICVERSHALTVDEIKTKVEPLIEKLETKLAVKSEWESERVLNFRRKGAKGNIIFDGDTLQLTLNLGMMFRALKGPIEAEINTALDKYLA